MATENLYNPEMDGVDHINVYTKARTDLGRYLSNMALAAVRTRHGIFNCMEGYWYWLGTGMQHDQLKETSGHASKVLGKTLPIVHLPEFDNFIREALTNKILLGPNFNEFAASTLPLAHYYWYGEIGNCKVVPVKGDITVKHLSHLREILQLPVIRICILGSRDLKPYVAIKVFLKRMAAFNIKVLSGLARGVDLVGKEVAESLNITVDEYPADWDGLGKGAGHMRNEAMAKDTDLALVIWDGQSAGTKDMLKRLVKKNIPYVLLVTKVPS